MSRHQVRSERYEMGNRVVAVFHRSRLGRNFIFKIELYSFLNVLIIGMFCGVDRIYAETWPVQTRPTGTHPANKFYFNTCMIL